MVGTIAELFLSNDFAYLQGLFLLIKGSIIPKDEDELRPLLRMCDLGSRYAIALGGASSLIAFVLTLGNLRDSDALGPNMAVALIGPLYGILFSELFWLPLKANILARFYDLDSQKDKIMLLAASQRLTEIENSKRYNVIILSVVIPIIVFSILFISISEYINPSPAAIPYWEKVNVQEVVLSSFEINNSKNSEETHLFLEKDSISVEGVSDEIFFPKDGLDRDNKKYKYRALKVTVEPLSKLNHKQSKLFFTIESHNRKSKTDSLFETINSKV